MRPVGTIVPADFVSSSRRRSSRALLRRDSAKIRQLGKEGPDGRLAANLRSGLPDRSCPARRVRRGVRSTADVLPICS